MMNSLKIKSLFALVLFLSISSASYARFEVKRTVFRFCEKVFKIRVSKNTHMSTEDLGHSIINHLTMVVVGNRRDDPVLSRYIDEFRANILSLIQREENSLSDSSLSSYFDKFRANATSLFQKEGNSLSELLHIQERFNRLIFPWLFWRSTERNSKEIFNMRGLRGSNKNRLRKWAEDSLGRSLNEQEVQALEEAYSYDIGWMDIRLDVQFFTKQKILKEAGFSEKEMDQLGRKATLQGSGTIALEIPQRTSIETLLRGQGYEPDSIKGMDETEELKVVGKQVLERFDEIGKYYTVHSPYLAQKLKEYIAYMEKGISNSIQRKNFERLKEYLKILIEEEGVTYDKFLAVSLRSVDILSENDRPNSLLLQDFLKLLPERIAMPTIAGLIGYMSLNDTRSEKVESIALVRENTFVDGNELTPIGVVNHEKFHIIDADRTDRNFYNKLKQLRGKLPVETVQNAEIAYHNLTHESQTVPLFTIDFLEMTIDSLRFELLSNFFRLQYKNEEEFRAADFKDLEQKAQVIIDDFEYVFNIIISGV